MLRQLDRIDRNGNYHIAIYHTGALGDLLVATAAIYEAVNLFPNSKFTLIGSSLWKEILLPINWPQIFYILETTDKKFKKLKYWKSIKTENIWNEVNIEKKSFSKFLTEFQITIDLRSESLRFALKAFSSKVHIRIGASKNKLVKPFFTHFSLREKNKEIHERDRYLDILSPLNKAYIEERKIYWEKIGLPPLKWFPNDYQQHLFSIIRKKVILINPTASIREKAWASKNFRELALKLKNSSYEIKIIGSLNETEWLKEVAQDDFNIIQPNNIIDLIDTVKGSSLLITNTSSMQFVAASTHTPTLTLMGTASPKRWGALGDSSYCLKNMEYKENRAPLFSLKKNIAKINESDAYNSISVNLVLETVQKLLVNNAQVSSEY